MKRTLLIILLLASATIIYAQPTPKYPKMIPLPPTDTAPVNGVYRNVEHGPEFPGGYNGFNEFLAKNLKYPKTAGDVRGKVFLEFIVEIDGSLSNISVVRV